MLGKKQLLSMNLNVDHGHSMQPLMFCTTLLLWMITQKFRKIMFRVYSIRLLWKDWNYFRLLCRKIDPV